MLRDQDDSVIQVMSGDSHDGKAMPMMYAIIITIYECHDIFF